ncbi:hypothetical protein [Methylocystis sp. SB2]|uniref:hypothetical protein n=1 Tax=Methylocystis sp. (strain SB2) TaxID=743836 RepID=UPI00040A6F92|nr:hypothetical protein [Methylocystis sp. SB2]ULO23760.1 hypothetical protein LNB28_16825 [Methylocystis sp. SB2]
MIASLASGGDVLDKQKTKIENLRAQIENAKLERANWRLAEQAVEARRHALGLAALFVVVAARAVVTKEVNAAATMCAGEAIRNEVLDMQSRLAALANSMEYGSEQRRTIDNFVDDVGWLIDSPWRDRPAAQPIRDAFDKLCTDASAALKV